MSRVKTAAVIGAGFGGIALAIRLQSAGIKTTLIEKRDKPGGRAYVYHDNGFVFDAGPTVITDPTALEDLFTLSGRRMADYVELLPVTPFYQLRWEDGARFDYVNDPDELACQIAGFNPDDVKGYERFLAYSRDLLTEGYEKLGAVPFLNFWSMVRAAPQLIRLESHRSVYSKVSEFIQDEHLRQAFSFHSLLVGGNPFATSAIYALIHALERKWGVWFAKGGTGALISALVRLFQELGGTCKLSAPVDHIGVEDRLVRTVRTKDGWSGQFDAIASNADIVHTYSTLLGHTHRGKTAAEALKRKRFSMSLFVIYFGLKRQHPELKHHTILLGPRYRALIAEIFNGRQLPEDFSLYLHAPSVTDPSMAPPGCSAYYVLAPVPHLGAAPIDWSEEGPRYRDKILTYLEKSVLPDLRRDLVTSRIFTPLDFKDEVNAHLGSAFSVEPILTQSAYFRPHNRDDVIPNLYIVGAGTHPGAGIPGVVGSAKATAGLMLEDLGANQRGAA